MDSRKAYAAIIVIAVLAIAGAAAVVHNSHQPTEDDGRTFPTDIPEGERTYTKPSDAYATFAGSLAEMGDALESGSDPTAIGASIESCYQDLTVLRDEYVWSYLFYHLEPARYSESFVDWDATLVSAEDGFFNTVKESMNGDRGEIILSALGSISVDPRTFLDYDEASPEELILVQRLSELRDEYASVMGAEYTASYGGRTWTLDEARSSTVLTDRELALIVRDIEMQRYTDAATVYIDIVSANNDYAELQGYDSYPEYSYDVMYGRDYSVDDVGTLNEYSEEAVALYLELYRCLYSMETGDLSYLEDYGGDDILGVLEKVVGELGGEYARLLDYMQDNGLLFLDPVDGQIGGSFTYGLEGHNSAVIYHSPDGVYGPATVVHEFGHAANLCLNRDPSDCLDVMEIHSQGLESLFMSMMDECIPSSAEEYTVLLLFNMNYQVVLSSMLTEFENWAFETEDSGVTLTVDSLTSKFESISEEYGCELYYSDIGSGYDWAWVSHMFDAPTYYISYGVSALNAMEIFLACEEDMDLGKGMYMWLTEQNGVHGYVDAVERAGLSNVFADGNGSRILSKLSEWVEDNCGS